MGQTFTAAAMGNSANDNSGNELRVGGLKIAADLTELYEAIAALTADPITASSILRAGSATANGSVGQVIAYSSAFDANSVVGVIDNNALGVQVTANDADGFTITSLTAGDFIYFALIKI